MQIETTGRHKKEKAAISRPSSFYSRSDALLGAATSAAAIATAASATTAAAALPALAAGFRGATWVVGEVAAAVLAAFASGLCSALGVMREIAAAVLSALASGFCGPLGIIGEIATAFVAAFAAGLSGKLAIPRKATLFVRDALTTFPGDFALFLRIHSREATVRRLVVFLSHPTISLVKGQGDNPGPQCQFLERFSFLRRA